MAYAPKKMNYKIRWKFVVPTLILISLLLYTMISLMIPDKKEEKKFTVCGLNEQESVKLLNKKVALTYPVSDYTYYGESLGLYTTPYSGDHEDDMSGKTLEVHNLCSDKTVPLTIDTEIDQKITLNDLDPGFYELSIIDNLVEKRVVYHDVFKGEPFYTVKRNDKVRKVSIIANKDLLHEYDISWPENYLFLNVENSKPQNDTIDVYLDPYGMNTDFQYVPDKGNIGNGLSEYSEMYDAALMIKKQLEQHGLRVAISRSSKDEDALPAYGKDGRLAKAYEKQAKYYISLRFNKSETTSMRGIEVWHSSHASDVLGKNIVYGLQENLGMMTSNYIDNEGTGVGSSPVDKGYFDSNIYLRETGGKATFAAMYSDLSKEENIFFKDSYGMNAIEIDLGYVSNSEDAEFWKAHKEEITKQIADSFAQGIGL